MADPLPIVRPNRREDFEDLPVIGMFQVTSRKEQVAAQLREHDRGNFRMSASLFDEVLTDDRISGCFEQRIAGLKAAPLVFEPAKPNRRARKLADLLGGTDKMTGRYRDIVGPDALSGLLEWGIGVGVAVAQILVERTAGEWWPTLRVWHPEHVRWDEMKRRFILQHRRGEIDLPRPDEQPHGDGQWFVWCPYGVQYGWKRALIRSLANKYVSRQWSERDWDRYDERQGMAILKALVPAGANQEHKLQFFRQLANIGSEAAVLCPKNQDGSQAYDLQVVEFLARSWEAFEKRQGSLNVDIAVRILGQNLTTEVKEGSFAAAKTANLVRLDKAVADSEIGAALRAQVLYWWALWNYGDGELAPWPRYYVEPPDDDIGEATALKTLAEAIVQLKSAEARVDHVAILEEAGVPLVSEAEAEAQAEAEAGAGAGETKTVLDDEGNEVEIPADIPDDDIPELLAQVKADQKASASVVESAGSDTGDEDAPFLD